MSRVGKQPIALPSGVNVEVDKGNLVIVTGPKGSLNQQVSPDLDVSQEGNEIVVKRPTDMRHHRSQHGLARSLINNMVIGVSEGFIRRLEIHGTGYRAEQKGKNLVLMVGKSHPVEFEPSSSDMSFEVAKDGRFHESLNDE